MKIPIGKKKIILLKSKYPIDLYSRNGVSAVRHSVNKSQVQTSLHIIRSNHRVTSLALTLRVCLIAKYLENELHLV